jgi:copper(I)-binding protein
MIIKTAITVAVGLFLGFLAVGAATASAMEGLKASDVQIRATAPGMTATGGYVTIHNHSDEADRLVGVAAEFAAKAEIHTMMHENGVMKMRALSDGIEIPAGGMVELAPGGPASDADGADPDITSRSDAGGRAHLRLRQDDAPAGTCQTSR